MKPSQKTSITRAATLSILALLLNYVLGWPLVRQACSVNYAVTTGTITQAAMGVSMHYGRNGGTYHYPDFRYFYEADGKSYTGQNYRYVSTYALESADGWVKQVLAGHPVGSEAQVFYNPHNPGDAILSRGLNRYDLIKGGLIGLFDVGALVWWIPIYRSFKKSRRQSLEPA